VHGVDSIKIAKRLNDQRPAHLPPLNICIEVNISNEITKSGVTADEVAALADYCLTQPQLKLRGLMTIPTPYNPRCEYQKLHTIWTQLRDKGIAVDTLSMGLSNDFEAAIAEGATIVRIGWSLFGHR
jgi:pyridoxal phosphate enzyme (YggS family)